MPELIALKGRRDDFGPALESRPDIRYIGRRMSMGGWRLEASPFANPFSIKDSGGAQQAVEFYRSWLRLRPDVVAQARRELAGAELLGCWGCAEAGVCHGMPLLEILSGDPSWDLPAGALGECGDAPVLPRDAVTVRLRPEWAGAS